jgi:predicted RNA-binding protein with RPS1 domain
MFIEVEKSIDGMIHISEVSKDFLKNISDKYKVGDEIEAEIIEINDDKQKVKLSIKKI